MRDKWYVNTIQSPPPECEQYLITDDVGEMQVAYWTNYSSVLGEVTNIWRWVGLRQYTHVVAWRLLPEAYKEEH